MSTGRFPTITDDALDALRGRIGRPVRRPEPYIEVATRDAIRHWADGIGDRNPFWLRYGIAPPTILFAMDRVVSGYVGGLPGIHAMYAGTDFRWCLPINEGDRIIGESVLLDLVEKPSAFARRAIQQTYRTTFRNRDGAVVCEADSWCFRTERDAARERGKYRGTERARYTPEEIERIRRSGRGVGEPLRAGARARLRSVRASSGARHSERIRRPGASRARALGRALCAGRRCARRVRLRAGAGGLARPPGHQLDG